MGSYQSPLSAIVKGAIAGAAGTWAMGEAMSRAPQLLERAGYRLPEAPPGPAAPDTPTEEVAERLAEGLAQDEIDEGTKQTAGQVIHWSYGAAWGAAYGVLQATLKLPTLLGGAFFGAGVGYFGERVMPALRLQNAPERNPRAVNLMQMGAHVVYGVAVALAWRVLNLGRRG
ncbi:MAG TPA: hypothetical protein VF071_08165 [Candidatus Limnocylindria bacterium]